MLHGVGFLQYVQDKEPRGTSHLGSVNWIMGHVRRSGAYGDFQLRGMVSLEPVTISGCGYPVLLASGEVCDGQPIVDKQHPHDLFMELAAVYTKPLTRQVGIQLYAAPAGEPALGPVAFPHRVSAFMNPLAPISHHWLDATHISHGVVTAGVFGRRWKFEGSAFNGREPDDERYDFDLGKLDSYSGRLSVLPTSRLSLQVSGARLKEAEQHASERVDVDRITASVIHHKPLSSSGIVATTLAWGHNFEEGERTQAGLAELSVSVHDSHVLFARGEVVQKSAGDLNLHADEAISTCGKFNWATRNLRRRRGGGGQALAGACHSVPCRVRYRGRMVAARLPGSPSSWWCDRRR
jgi:hypothetical protein